MQLLTKSALPAWVARLTARYRLYGPVRRGGRDAALPAAFAEVHDAQEMDLDYGATLLPPKKYLLPPRETLVRFEGNGGAPSAQADLDAGPVVVFGVHTCDLHAFALLDHVYGAAPADQHYRRRRENTTFVSIECLQPCSANAFCRDMDTLTAPDAFDLHLTDLGEEYAVVVGSEKGAALLDGLAPYLRPAGEEGERRLDETLSAKWPRFDYRLPLTPLELPRLLKTAARSPVWQTIGEECLSCGACTLVCPTCTCFDVCDQVDFSLSSGERQRIWDSCLFRQFATVAGGHDFRAGRGARLRHRFNRKYRYQLEATGIVGCVGCGRCSQACLVSITPPSVLNKLHQQAASPVSGVGRKEGR